MSNSLNWEYYKLSELATFRRGSFPQPYGLDKWYDDVNGFPFVQVFDVGENMKLKNTTKRRISSLAGEQSVFVEKGTIILTIQGTIGRIAITHYDTYIDRTLLIFQSFKLPTDKKYFMYVVHRLFEDEKKRAHGSTIATITKEQLSSFVIPLPPLPEQQKIAEILSTVDDKIEVIDQQITETQELKKGLMQRLLTKGIGHTEFKDSALGEIPSSWEVFKLNEISNVVRGGSPRPAGSPLLFNGDYLPWITVAELTNSAKKYITNTKTKLTKLGSTQTRILEIDTVVLANSGATLGIPRILKIRGGANDGIAAFLSLTKVSNDYLYFYLQSLTKYFREQLAPGSGQPNLNTSLIGGVNITIPSITEQVNITNILNSIDDKLEVLSEKKTHYQELKQGLMQQLLTGKVRVK